MSHPAEQLRAVERAAVAEEVAAVLRHDLRGKLSSIRNAAYYLQRRLLGPAAVRNDARVAEFFQMIERAVRDAEQVLRERAVLGEVFAAAIGPTALDRVARHALAAHPPPPSVLVEATLDSVPVVLADATELVLMVRCLIDNACEAMAHAGGTLQLGTALEPDAVLLTVADTGGGFASEARPFVPFRAVGKPGHAGLGLCIARRIAERYQGRLEIAPVPQGTRVDVRFARVDGVFVASSARTPSTGGPGPGGDDGA